MANQAVEEPQQQQLPALRSIHNRISSFVRFYNNTRFTVCIFWIDYQGKPISYKRLGPTDFLDCNTFVTHPWIFVEWETQDRFLGNGREVYFPEPFRGYRREVRGEQLPPRIVRTVVTITLPLYSLRDMCLRVIKRSVNSDSDAFRLELPKSLQRELHDMHPRKPDAS